MLTLSETRAREGRPVRLQLSRKKGFDLQAHSRAVNGMPAVNVARPSRWGNPYSIGKIGKTIWIVKRGAEVVEGFLDPAKATSAAVQAFQGFARFREIVSTEDYRRWIAPLAGRNLACWCPAGCGCHADVLLRLANGPVCEALPASLESQKEGAADSASVKERA